MKNVKVPDDGEITVSRSYFYRMMDYAMEYIREHGVPVGENAFIVDDPPRAWDICCRNRRVSAICSRCKSEAGEDGKE